MNRGVVPLSVAVPVYYEQGILGSGVKLPCDISIAEGPQEAEDSVVLVLWYREDKLTPVYRYVYDIMNIEYMSDVRRVEYFGRDVALLLADTIRTLTSNLYGR
jgi:hypothetical protein